ncbi:phytase [Pseudoalteromonas sp. MMG010]|uniref:phytase n=1 Tax=Pseudoalteromonas sp. MMG010 TaxID=2822685 RepID=UPI001B3A4069|nr:phytase [Pseudoalteromonas sp. MMG010]MBQ4833140.1 phytase [Pseudoalteromonas sp. MMG010]
MNFKLNRLLTIITATVISSALIACSHQNNTASAPATISDFGPMINMQGSQAVAINNQFWLLASETKGLVLTDSQNTNSTVIAAGSFESLSIEAINEQSFLVATVDNNKDNVVIFKLENNNNTWRINELNRVRLNKSKPETVCLFHNERTQLVSAFTPDVRGLITETLVFDINKNVPTNLTVRQFSGVSEAAGCAVNHRTNTLYISESDTGIWAINANAESKENKKPVLLTQPFGKLPAAVGALTIASDARLWFTTSSEGNSLIFSYNPFTDELKKWPLNTPITAESVAISYNDNKAMAVLYNDDTGAYVSTALASTAYNLQTQKKVQQHAIYAQAQTTPVKAFGDAADDPAIWVHPNTPDKSLILGTDKRRGLMVYNLQGMLQQSIEVGRLNNVDIRQNTHINNPTNTLIAASNRTTNSISLFSVDTNNTVFHLSEVTTNLDEIYGLCMYSSRSGHYVFVNDKSGLYQQYKITQNGSNLKGALVREFSLPSQPEGCSADDERGQLFAGEEDAGIWFINAEPDADTAPIMLQTINEQLVDDVEGMEIYQSDNTRYLVVSSQGDHSYVVYKIFGTTAKPSLVFSGKFNIIANLNNAIDGVSETDGLTVTAKALPGYPEGILIVQDGYNRMPQQPQNFKIIDWRDVKKGLK